VTGGAGVGSGTGVGVGVGVGMMVGVGEGAGPTGEGETGLGPGPGLPGAPGRSSTMLLMQPAAATASKRLNGRVRNQVFIRNPQA